MATTVLEIAGSDRFLSKFLRAFNLTALAEELSKSAPFTFFAPVNLAFETVDNKSFDELMKPANRQWLTDILGYHIVNGKMLLKDFRNGQKLETLNGKVLVVSIKDNNVHINGAKILSRDKQASNGVLHCVDAVNLP